MNHVYQALSSNRIGRYIHLARGDLRLALQYYHINMRLAAALNVFPSLLEVILRNQIDITLRKELGDDWLVAIYQTRSPNKRGLQWHEHEQYLVQKACRQIERQQKVDQNSIVAALSFGFWRNLIQHYGESLWKPCFRNMFAGLHQNEAFTVVKNAVDLRNRIAHHEPIIFEQSRSPNLVDWSSLASTHIYPSLNLINRLTPQAYPSFAPFFDIRACQMVHSELSAESSNKALVGKLHRFNPKFSDIYISVKSEVTAFKVQKEAVPRPIWSLLDTRVAIYFFPKSPPEAHEIVYICPAASEIIHEKDF